MANSVDQKLQGLQLSAEEIKRNNPGWSDEMVLDYIGNQEDIRAIAKAVSQIVFPMILAALKKEPSAPPIIQKQESSVPVQLIQQMANQQALQLVQSVQQQRSIVSASIDGYAKLTLASFAPTIPAASSQQVTGMTAVSKSFTVTGQRITAIAGGFVRVSVYCEADTDTNAYAGIQVRKNGSTLHTANFLSAVGTERKPVCLTFEDSVNKNDYYELYVDNPSGGPVTFDIQNIIFSTGY